MMNGGEILDSIPSDLTFEIFSRLPKKSIGRFRCVSKLWGSMLGSPDFTKLLLIRSSACPRLLFAVEGECEWNFYSSPQPQNPYEKSLVVAADFHMKFSKDMWPGFRGLTSGLIYFYSKWIWKVDKDAGRVICNPITGQYAILPELIKSCTDTEYSFLGFDPIDKQFKVLSIIAFKVNNETVHHILTLGTGQMRWRKIKCPLTHKPLPEGICISGILYYLATKIGVPSNVIVCLDIRFEKFKFIDAEFFCNSYATYKFVNYKGKLGRIHFKTKKLGGIALTVVGDDVYDSVIELRMWVLKDVEKHEWLKYVYTFPDNGALDPGKFDVAGVTARGEIVFSQDYLSKPFFAVVYFNPERNTLQRVEIHGNYEMLANRNRVYAYVDYVEDLKFNIVKTTYAATSISPLEHKRKRATALKIANKFDALCLLDDDDDEFTGVINT